MNQSNGSISKSSIPSLKQVQYTADKSPINLKSDINDINPDIDINNNSPLHIESGSQWIEDFDSKKSKRSQVRNSQLSGTHKRSKQIQRYFNNNQSIDSSKQGRRNFVNKSQNQMHNSTTQLKQESESPYKSERKNPRVNQSQTIDFQDSDLKLNL